MSTDNRAPPYSLRLETGLRAKLDTAAKIAGRSLHSEISLRLISTFEDEPLTTASPTNVELFRMLEELRGRVDALENRTN